MEPDLRRVVTFKSTAFNVTEPRSYFINECCFGDDLGKWLLTELRSRGHRTDDEPGQEDFGWYLNFEIAGIGHCLVLLYRPDDVQQGATWIGELERKRGFSGSILGRRKQGIQRSAVEAIHHILVGFPGIQDVRWHRQEDFDKGIENQGSTSPAISNGRADTGE